ncbi:hypothetical protein B1B04_15925 [Lysinibacillus sp. KCTC 33748]|nr:hypothetical protein B1B04_15925 [Lysinibacillus sp. KCTC 33748]
MGRLFSYKRRSEPTDRNVKVKDRRARATDGTIKVTESRSRTMDRTIKATESRSRATDNYQSDGKKGPNDGYYLSN